MSVLIDILPFSNSLEINGDCSAYSLSGNVAITIEPSSSLFSRQRTTRLLLQSLVLTFEGQSELVSPQTGYSSYRICSIAKELVPQKSVELSNEGCENSHTPCTWNVIFSLRIPGWLPPSSTFGCSNGGPVGTQYLLHATAKFAMIEVPFCNLLFGSRLLSALCNPRVKGSKIIRAPKCNIIINRVVVAPSSSETLYRTFCVEAQDQQTSAIPTSVLSKIRIMVSVPQHVDMNDDSFQLRLRVRADDMEATHCQRLRMNSFSVDILQQEVYRTRPSNAYLARYPVPPEMFQPPNMPLLAPHPVAGLQTTNHDFSADRAFSVMPLDSSRLYQLSDDGYIFTPESEDGASCTWYAMEPLIPFVHEIEAGDKDWGQAILRSSGTSPLFVVRHVVYLSMVCTYDVEGDQSKRVMAKLRIAVPVRFGDVREYSVGPMVAICTTDSRSSSGSWDSPNERPYYLSTNLPAYSQLFDSNGERKMSDPLPVYTPTCSSPSMSTLEFAEFRTSNDV